MIQALLLSLAVLCSAAPRSTTHRPGTSGLIPAARSIDLPSLANMPISLGDSRPTSVPSVGAESPVWRPSASVETVVPGAAAANAPQFTERPGVDPRGAGFEDRAWTQAERLGFERKRDAGPGLPGAAGFPPLQASQPAPEGPKKDTPAPAASEEQLKAPSLWSRVVIGFFSSYLFIQVALEGTALAVSQMTEPLKHGFLALGGTLALTYGAYALGSFLGGRIVDRFGIRTVFRSVLVVRTGIWTAMAYLLFSQGAVPLVALAALYSMDYFFHSISRVAENKLQVAWYHGEPIASSRFGTMRDFLEYGTVLVGALAGLAISYWGFGAVIYPAPFLFGAAALLAFLFKGLPQFAAEKSRKVDLWAGMRTMFAHSGILKPFVGHALINGFLFLLYYIVATAFGAYAGASTGMGAAIAGSLTGVYGIGAILGTYWMTRINDSIEKTTEFMPEPQRTEERQRRYERSASTALKWAALAMMGAWLFLSQTQLASLVWPYFAISPALIFIGMAAQVAFTHLDTIMKERIPKDSTKELAGSIVGAIRTLSYLSQVLGFLAWGALFQVFGAQALLLFAVFSTGIAAVYWWLSRAILAR